MIIIQLVEVTKDYNGLRPLRIEHLEVAEGDRLAIVGLDRAAAEVLVNLVTAAALPDRGEVLVFGRPTSAILNGDEWLALVDRFGIVSDRTVLLEGLSVLQNLALPFSLNLDPLAPDAREQATALAREVGISVGAWERPIADLDAVSRVRVRLGRALALRPALALLEHPTAGIVGADEAALGREIRAVLDGRRIAALTLTADRRFAAAVAGRVVTHEPATGRLIAERRAGWFRR